MRSLSCFALFVLLGCGQSHGNGDAGTPPVDSGSEPIACQGEWSTVRVGDPCFCQGPFARRGTIVYRASDQLEVIDVSSPDAPRLVRGLPLARLSSQGGVAIAGDRLIVAGSGIEIFDLTDPQLPVSRGTIPDVNAYGVTADATHAYVSVTNDAATTFELLVIDPLSVAIAGRAGLPTTPGAVSLVGTTAYVGVRETDPAGQRDSVVIVDVSDPAVPAVRDRFDVGARALLGPVILARGSTLWVGGTEPAAILESYDLETHALLGSLSGSGWVVAMSSTDQVLLLGGQTVQFVDPRDPRRPRLAGALAEIGDNGFTDVVDGHVLASNGNGFSTATLSCSP